MQRSRRTALAAVLLAGTALTGVAFGVRAQTQPVNPPAEAAPRAMLPDFTWLVTQVRPAVVSITATVTTVEDEGPGAPTAFPFNRMVPRGPQANEGHIHQASGSGFIIRPDGLIVTNNHMIQDNKALIVTLDDGTELHARVLGSDPRTDIAVLKVDAGRTLPFIQLGNSRDVKPGEWVVAMGNPFGLGGSVTAGIVSALSRDIGSGPYDQFIQIDAPINPGNSGGPLFTQDGKVVGMNTAIYSPTGGSVGIGFAIPSDMIRTVADQLASTGHVTRGFVGVGTQAVSPAMAKALHLTGTGGALLASVTPGSPASKAGLEPGDVIEAVNGQKIVSAHDLALTVATVAPGQEANFHVLRDGQDRDVAVQVGEQPLEKTAQAHANEPAGHGQLGLALAPLTPEARDQLQVPDGTGGAVVRGVRPNSPAAEAGLRPGDVIVGVGTQKVSSAADASKAIGAALSGKDHTVALRVMRDGTVAFVGVSAGQG
jgi:serine protease Do